MRLIALICDVTRYIADRKEDLDKNDTNRSNLITMKKIFFQRFRAEK